MGWWWKSDPSKETPSSTNPSTSPESTSTQNVPPKKLTPDEQADLEFNQLLADLRKADGESSNNSPSSAGTSDSSTSGKPTSSIAPESLYADTMSCRTAFDYAFFCQSFGGQFVNVYRYGELRSCSEHWDNFWLCMKTRGWSDELRRKTIRDHNRKRAIKYKTGPSSEDVWDVRLDPATEAFKGDFAALEKEMKAEEEARQKAAA